MHFSQKPLKDSHLFTEINEKKIRKEKTQDIGSRESNKDLLKDKSQENNYEAKERPPPRLKQKVESSNKDIFKRKQESDY